MSQTQAYGWTGRLLRVDLSSGRIWEEESRSQGQEFIGGRGLGTALAWEEIPPGVGALDPENVLMFLTGPFTGTTAPMSGRVTVCGLGPQGYPHEWFTRGSMGGHWGPELKYAGYDGVVITGRAEAPVYLWINDGRCEIRDARHLWGKGSYSTQEVLLAEHGDKIRLATIGQAGENLSRIAIINSETESCVGQGGFGAVMGSKNLKALAVGGTGAVRIARPDEFLRRSLAVAQEVRTCDAFNRRGISSARAGKYGEKVQACSQQCAVQCARYYRDVPGVVHPDVSYSGQLYCTSGRFAGGNRGPYYRFQLGFEAGFEIANLANDYGINHWDLIRGIMTYLTACRDQGLMAELDGTPIDFDSPHFWAELLRKIAYREGTGDVLAEGGRRAIESIGLGQHMLDDLYVGWGYTNHMDGHRLYGNYVVYPYWITTALLWAVESRDCFDSTHDAVRVMSWSPLNPAGGGLPWEKIATVSERLLGSAAALDPKSDYEGKAAAAVWHGHRSAFKDSLPICDVRFPRMFSLCTEDGMPRLNGVEGPDFEHYLLVPATGLEVSPEDLDKACERILNLDRAIQVRNFGRSRADDESIIPYFEREEAWANPLVGEKKCLDGAKFRGILEEYYQLRGWDLTQGRPTRGKLEELGLKHVADELSEQELI
jgi:aldehyde:ferredoxin oxidoreductase